MSFDHKTIEHDAEYGWYAVYGHGTYPRHSVLAGQPSRTFIDCYESVELAKAAHPDAEESGCTKQDVHMPETAPSWFDPADAGECWHEDDY